MSDSRVTKWLTSIANPEDGSSVPEFVRLLRETSHLLAGSRRGSIAEFKVAVDESDDGRQKLESVLAEFFATPVDEILNKYGDNTLLANLFELVSLYPAPASYGKRILELRHSSAAREWDPQTRSLLLDALIENQVRKDQWEDWCSIITTGQSEDGVLRGRSVDGWDGWRLMWDGQPHIDLWIAATIQLLGDEDRFTIALQTLDLVSRTFLTERDAGCIDYDSTWEAQLLIGLGQSDFPEEYVLRMPKLLVREPTGSIVAWKMYVGFFKSLLPKMPVEDLGGQIARIDPSNSPAADSLYSWIKLFERARRAWSADPSTGRLECYNCLKDRVAYLRDAAQKADKSRLNAVFNAFELRLSPSVNNNEKYGRQPQKVERALREFVQNEDVIKDLAELNQVVSDDLEQVPGGR